MMRLPTGRRFASNAFSAGSTSSFKSASASAAASSAAFVARPHVGAGVAKAADDATALADALLKDDVEPALKAFEAKRLPVGSRIIEYARHLGAYLQATRTQEEQARAGRHSTAESVISETALMDFLDA